jgi:hypothetical protein
VTANTNPGIAARGDPRLHEILSWSARCIDQADQLYASYLEVFLTALQESTSTTDCLHVAFTLPDTPRARILTSPELYRRLVEVLRNRIPLRSLCEFIERSTAVELCRLGCFDPNGFRAWSANGDYFFDHGPAVPAPNSTWHTRGRYEAPLLAKRIPLDFTSDWARSHMPVAAFRTPRFGPATPFSRANARIAVSRIQESFARLSLAVPPAAAFFLRYVSAVVLRNDPTNRGVFQSASRNSYVGQMVLLNPHTESVDEAYLAESIVHESIHSFMWRIEILFPFLRDTAGQMPVVESPWSGQKIYYYTLLQAGLVWFGIANFWRLALESDHFSRRRAETLYRRAIKGFKNDAFLACVHRNEYLLREGVLSIFEHISGASRRELKKP